METLSHKKGQPLCSIVSLDHRSAALVTADGEGDTFSVEPMTHLAKLAPAVAVDPTPSALFLSGYDGLEWEGGQEEGYQAESAVSTAGGGGDEFTSPNNHGRRGRSLRADNSHSNGERGNTEDALASWHGTYGMPCPSSGRRRAMDENAAAEAAAATARAARPTTRGLIEDGKRGKVDAIEITLAPRPRWVKQETESLARRWLALADDQASLAKVLRRDHFWGREQHTNKGDGIMSNVGDEDGESETMGSNPTTLSEVAQVKQDKSQGESQSQSEGAEGIRHPTHEERKRMGWGSLLDHVHEGRGRRQWSLGRKWGRRAPGSCGFAQARFSVAPSGKKIIIHGPHEIGINDASGGCLSALLAYVSMQPEVHYMTARRRTAMMNLDAAWVTQSGIISYTPLWDEVRVGQISCRWPPPLVHCFVICRGAAGMCPVVFVIMLFRLCQRLPSSERGLRRKYLNSGKSQSEDRESK